MIKTSNLKIGVIGLGYVGLPVCLAFAKKYSVVGFDINKARTHQLTNFLDSNKEHSVNELKKSKSKIIYTSNENLLSDRNFFIITVPTPIDQFNNPYLNHLVNASKLVAKYLKKKSLVVYESTVYPGCTEEICLPILKESGLIFNKDFFLGYSPERINPGDKKRKIENIVKVVSGSNEFSKKFINKIYSSVISAGTYIAPSIMIAEASKVIENTQRDINVAFMNELYEIFKRQHIDIKEVLKAARTKWNFLDFKPGLVGGHCIGVDPYYLLHKSKSLNYFPELIFSSRRINEGTVNNIYIEIINKLLHSKLIIKNIKALYLGITFKENCNDIRNSKSLVFLEKISKLGFEIEVSDPNFNKFKFNSENISFTKTIRRNKYDIIFIMVKHKEFKKIIFENFLSKNGFIFDYIDIKG